MGTAEDWGGGGKQHASDKAMAARPRRSWPDSILKAKLELEDAPGICRKHDDMSRGEHQGNPRHRRRAELAGWGLAPLLRPGEIEGPQACFSSSSRLLVCLLHEARCLIGQLFFLLSSISSLLLSDRPGQRHDIISFRRDCLIPVTHP